MHAALEQACSVSGFIPNAGHMPSVAAFLDATSRHATARVCLPSPQVVEQAPQALGFHSYVMHASVLQALLFAGSVFVASAVQNESATLVTITPCVDLHELPVRTWVPPPQPTEHAP